MPRKKKKEPKHRNYLVPLVMKKAVKKHRNRKKEAKGNHEDFDRV
jgi:hypothetical protein